MEGKVVATLERIKREFSYTDVSRIRHSLVRAASATASGEEEETLKTTCVEKLVELLWMLKQRVTYDPDCSSEEIDSVARGAKSKQKPDSEGSKKEEKREVDRRRQISEMQNAFSKFGIG